MVVVVGLGIPLLSWTAGRRYARDRGEDAARRLTLLGAVAGLGIVAAVCAWALISNRGFSVFGLVWLTSLTVVFVTYGVVGLRGRRRRP